MKVTHTVRLKIRLVLLGLNYINISGKRSFTNSDCHRSQLPFSGCEGQVSSIN